MWSSFDQSRLNSNSNVYEWDDMKEERIGTTNMEGTNKQNVRFFHWSVGLVWFGWFGGLAVETNLVFLFLF